MMLSEAEKSRRYRMRHPERKRAQRREWKRRWMQRRKDGADARERPRLALELLPAWLCPHCAGSHTP